LVARRKAEYLTGYGRERKHFSILHIEKISGNLFWTPIIGCNISMISQFPYIFDMSIKENLLLVKKDATDEEIWDVLARACFDEDVKAMPKGIDTKVGETGVKLSGGQRQRLAIARALLKNSKIIMFDESTSSLDNFAQSHIQQSIENLKGQHTIIIVAHRLSTIKNVDTIYFLENGEIKGKGTFDELFNNNEDFQKMFLIENI
jgi:ABC-type multidrug transport system fused ATPase/permease subunit